MAFKEDLPVPQGEVLLRRVNAEISDKDGHLEDQSLDIDARTMAVLGKRQQLSVRPTMTTMYEWWLLTSLIDREILASFRWSRFRLR